MSAQRPLVAVVGPGTRFLGGITYYTFSLCNALNETHPVTAILMRRLLPRRLYPGRAHVGAQLCELSLAPTIHRYDGVDWFWGLSMLRALIFLVRQRPAVLLLQWWTGTVLHTYLVLAIVARLLGATVVVELHEVLDPGEDRLRVAGRYVNLVAPWLFRLVAGHIVHSSHDRQLAVARYGTARPVAVIPHATYGHYRRAERWRAAPPGPCNLLFFGLIRPYKGLDMLVQVFNSIPAEEIDRYWLTVVGETWEESGTTMELIACSPYRDRISLIDRYVSDTEAGAIFGGADIVVLPYQRSCGSGILHIALGFGLPVVVTPVGALVEAVVGYAGAVVAERCDPAALLAAIRQATELRGQRFADPRPWSSVPPLYYDFFARLGVTDTRLGVYARESSALADAASRHASGDLTAREAAFADEGAVV